MSKRLQVVMSEKELRELRRAAKRQDRTLSDWVREALRNALDRQPASRPKPKLDIIRAATRHEFPAPDVDQMNAEIAAGYSSGWRP